MYDALTMIEAGMSSDIQRMHAISHNLANVSTAGFKRDITVAHTFADQLNQAAAGNLRPTISTHVDHSVGSLKYTGNPLDVGLEDHGYFVVQTPNGEAYTRQGNLRIDGDGRLVTHAGHALVGSAGDIRLTTTEPSIDAQGNVWDGKVHVGQLRLVGASNPESMTALGQGLYEWSDSTEVGAAVPRVRQGFIEAANVVAMNEMIKMIETARHFEASQKLAHAYDDMLDRAINSGGEV